jgi:hypothetical protein
LSTKTMEKRKRGKGGGKINLITHHDTLLSASRVKRV